MEKLYIYNVGSFKLILAILFLFVLLLFDGILRIKNLFSWIS